MVFSESTAVEFSFLYTTCSSLDLHSNNSRPCVTGVLSGLLTTLD